MNAPGRLAGIDYGSVRIGIAITDASQSIASPLDVYTRARGEDDARFFRQLVEREDITAFVVGLPVHASGDESASSAAARSWGAWLAETTGLEVTYFDERYSSAQADVLLAEGNLTRDQRKRRRDMLAAQIMLAAYLESSRSGDEPGALE